MTSNETELMTPEEAAELLRTSVKAIYVAVQRGQLPGVVRLGRRVLFRRVDLRAHVGLLSTPAPSPVRAGSPKGRAA